MGATPLNGGELGAPGCGGACSGVDPSARGMSERSHCYPDGVPESRQDPDLRRGDGAQEALLLRVSPALGPLAGLSAPAGAGPSRAGLLRDARPKGLPYWADGQHDAGKEEEGGGRA